MNFNFYPLIELLNFSYDFDVNIDLQVFATNKTLEPEIAEFRSEIEFEIWIPDTNDSLIFLCDQVNIMALTDFIARLIHIFAPASVVIIA